MIPLALGVALVGLLIGSFLNVVVWRVPRKQSVVSPPSACPGCDAPIRPRDNLPVAGWVLLKGRCRDCGTGISIRYPLVELTTAALFGVMALRFGLDPVLPAYLYLVAVGVALALIDIDTKKLPNVLVLPSYVVGGALLAIGGFGDSGSVLRALLGGAAMYAAYYALAFVYPAGMGFGDVKLAGVLGAYTGFLGWGAWAFGLFAGFFLGGAFGIALIALGKGGRKSTIPYGPFMLVGALLAILVGQPWFDAYLGLTVG